MEVVSVLFMCAVIVAVKAQILNPVSNPVSTLGMGGTGWGNPLWHSGMRYPGLMQTSQLSSVTYPTWRSHPLFRMVPAVSEKNMGSNLPSDVINIAKVPSSQEVLTHMALANQNPKPYFDTMSDFLYEPQKTRTVLSSVPSVTSMAPMASLASMAPVAPTGPMSSIGSPLYMQGMNFMRTGLNIGDDCGPQEGTRVERGMDWLY